ncbi:MAG: hypothetical protein IKK53_02690 [Ruminiclostridium sp.]|nr:hypothetical protein [Ruminiclostridium sp.]
MDIRTEALRYLGYKGTPDAGTLGLIERAENAFTEIKPAHCWKVAEKGNCGMLLKGNDIEKHLEGCDRIIIFAATLGADADRLIRTAEITDMAYAVVLDAYASAFIEDYCDRCQSELQEKLGGFFTWRFSPGYGDYPISAQADFIRYLSADKQIGLTATESHILIPRKSVTAVIGISENHQHKEKDGCESCNMRDRCNFRKEGKSCGH